MSKPRTSDAIILLGLNPTAPQEAQALRTLGNHVTLITNGKASDSVHIDGRIFDLSDDSQVMPFLGHLRLSPARIAIATSAIRAGGKDIKEALASISVFEEKADANRNEAVEKLRPYLVEGLLHLSERYIPVSWI